MKPYPTKLKLHAAMLLALTSIVACNKCEMPEPDTRPPFEIAEARERFEQQLSQRTRSAAAESGGLYLGEIEVDWDAAVTSGGENLYSIDAPISNEYTYMAACDSVVMRTHTQLVSVKDKSSGAVKSYIRITVPTPEYARTHRMSDMRRLTNTGKQGDFSGLIIYTSMEGVPLYAVRTYKGEVILSASVLDHENMDYAYALRYILSGFTFFRHDNIHTRGNDTLNGGEIGDVIVTAYNYRSGTYVDFKKHPGVRTFDELRYEEIENSMNVGPSSDIGGGGGWNNNGSRVDSVNWKGKIKIVGPKQQNNNIKEHLKELSKIPIFQKLMEALTAQGVNITIMYKLDIQYEANALPDGLIEYRSLETAGELLEEIFHEYQRANIRMSQIDNKFEAKYVVAKYWIDETLENAPSIITDSWDDSFWNTYKDYIKNPTPELRQSIYNSLGIIGYKGKRELGWELPNYNTLK